MPNHVQNLITFTGDVSLLEDQTSPQFDLAALSLKLGVLMLHSEQEWSKYLDVTDYSTIVKDIDKGVEALDKEYAKSILVKMRELGVEAVGESWTKPLIEENLNQLNNPTAIVELPWYSTSLIMPPPIGVLLNGFNGSFYKSTKLESLANVETEYQWNNSNVGTKWGVYNPLYEYDQIAYNTAWGTLSDAAVIGLVQKVHELIGEEPLMFYCAEQGCGFCGEGVFSVDSDSKDWSLSARYEDMDICWVNEDDEDDEDGEEDIKKLLAKGYKRCDCSDSYYSPDGYLPNSLKVLEYYGWGG